MGQQRSRGVALFNAGRYFEAHEEFEDLWRAASGADRDLWQGLAQACAGLHTARGGDGGGRPRPGHPEAAARILRRGTTRLRRWLSEGAPAGEPLDVARLIRDLEEAANAIARGAAHAPPVMHPAAAPRGGSV